MKQRDARIAHVSESITCKECNAEPYQPCSASKDFVRKTPHDRRRLDYYDKVLHPLLELGHEDLKRLVDYLVRRARIG